MHYRPALISFVKVMLCAAAGCVAHAQDFSAADFFARTETGPAPAKPASIQPKMKPGGRESSFELYSLKPTAEDQEAKRPYWDQTSLAGSVARENRESRSPTGFNVDQNRFDTSVTLTHGNRRAGETVWAITPAFTVIDGEGASPAQSKRDTISYAPGLTVSLTPASLNPTDDDPKKPLNLLREISFGITLLNSWGESADTTLAGAKTKSQIHTLSVAPTLSFTRKFGEKAEHSIRLGAQYGYRDQKNLPTAAATSEDFYHSAALSAKLSLLLKEGWVFQQGITYEFPVHEHVSGVTPLTGDATVTTATGLQYILSGSNSLGLEYRHVFDDRANRVHRFTFSAKMAF